MATAVRRALGNIVRFGDTDVFPFPFERYVFDDRLDECCQLLVERDKNFQEHLGNHPPTTIETLTQVGYTGFRRATQIEPFWNAYYLALVLSIAEEIEAYRIPKARNIIFSYRYDWCEERQSIFESSNWMTYRKRSVKLAREANFVAIADIADFYPRINHHRLDNELTRAIGSHDAPSKIMKLLQKFSHTASYGVPVGGPASRLLAELALAGVDKLLLSEGVAFCRYADDYTIFCDSKAQAYERLVFLSESLFKEGLSLQKSKTRILASSEYMDIHKYLDPKNEQDPPVTEEQKLLNISIRYDPYSLTADEDYESLKEAVEKINVVSILSNEAGKASIDPTVTKQAINALKVLDSGTKEKAIRVLLDLDNLLALAPVFVNVMRAVRNIFTEMSPDGKDYIDDALVDLYTEHNHLLRVDLNLSYFVQALSRRHREDKEKILVAIFNRTSSQLLRRQIIQVMASWGCHHWLSMVLRKFDSFTEWEKRALLVGSYALGDEGRHWRLHNRTALAEIDRTIKSWASDRHQKKKPVPV